MTLIICPECDGKLSDTVEVCIHCGFRINHCAPVANCKAGILTVLGYRGSFLLSPQVHVYKNGVFVSSLAKGGILELQIEIDCAIEFKSAFGRSAIYYAKKDKNEKIRLGWNRITGKLEIYNE